MKLSRRDFIKGSGAAALVAALPISSRTPDPQVKKPDGYSEAGYSNGLLEINVAGETYYLRLYKEDE